MVHLAEQAEELTPERAARIAARRNHLDREAWVRAGALGEERLQRAVRMVEHDRGRERRAHDGAPDTRDELPPGHVRELRQTLQLRVALRRRVPALRIDRAEPADVGSDDEVPGHRREQAASRVDDCAARAVEVDGAERLVVRE